MKLSPFLNSLALTALLSAALPACTKKAEPAPEQFGQVSGSLTLDGTVVSYHSTKAKFARFPTSITMMAPNDNGKEFISINLNGLNSTLGKYKITYANAGSHAELGRDAAIPADATLTYSNNTTATQKLAGDGEVEITKYEDNYIEGTFFITAYNAAGKIATLRQGSFSGPIPR